MSTPSEEPSIEDLMARPVRPRLKSIFIKRGIDLQVVLWIGTFLIFAAHGAWPTPDSNETNYIGKAKHFWDNNWCKGDLFIESADAHVTYYLIFGWLTKIFSLPVVAWIGRIITWLGLAWAWQKMSLALFRRSEFGPLAAALFILFSERLHMAGEWVVGGVEGKGFSYIFAWWAIAEMLHHRWTRVFVLLGIASAFHVIVGAWVTLAALIVWGMLGIRHVSFMKILPGLLLGGLFALPSLWAGLQLTSGASSEMIAQTNEIYVFERLPHHLMPLMFREGFIARQLILMFATACFVAVVFSLSQQNRDADARLGKNAVEWNLYGIFNERLLILTTLVSVFVIIAMIGFLSVHFFSDKRSLASFLRFYWFRESDAFVPVLAALAIWRIVEELRPRFVVLSQVVGIALCGLIMWDTSAQVTHWPFSIPGLHAAQLNPRPEIKRIGSTADDTNAQLEFDPADWRDACEWVKESTPPNALFLTPRISETFKWHAERAELVTKKDLPQNATAIITWWNLMNDVHGNKSFVDPSRDSKWQRTLADSGPDGLKQICEKYNVDYAIVHYRTGDPRLALKPVYSNKSFDVFRMK